MVQSWPVFGLMAHLGPIQAFWRQIWLFLFHFFFFTVLHLTWGSSVQIDLLTRWFTFFWPIIQSRSTKMITLYCQIIEVLKG